MSSDPQESNGKEEFNAFRERNQAEEEAARLKFMSLNDIDDLLKDGCLIEYEADRDHLYVTFGEPREGRAFFLSGVTYIADPETLRCFRIEVVDFARTTESGLLGEGWKGVLGAVRLQPTIPVPPPAEMNILNMPSMHGDELSRFLSRV